MKMNHLVVSVLSILSLTACVSNLTTKEDLSSTNFVVGQTTKKEVLDHLGLPEKVIRSDDGGEQYFYAWAATLTGFTVGTAGGGVYNTGPGALDTAINSSMVENGAIFRFDKHGVLISENSPKTRNK